MACNCKCTCKPDSISFWWMHDNHTFTRLLGKNLKEIVLHAQSIRKESHCGMLCTATLLNNGNDLRRVGICVHDNENWNSELKKWIQLIEDDQQAYDLIQNCKINE